MSDTSPEARQVQLDAFKAMTPEQRVAMAVEMSEDLKAISEAGRKDRDNRGGAEVEELRKALKAIHEHGQTVWSSTAMGGGGMGGQTMTLQPHPEIVAFIAYKAYQGATMKEIADEYAERNPGCSRLDEPPKRPNRSGPDGRPV